MPRSLRHSPTEYQIDTAISKEFTRVKGPVLSKVDSQKMLVIAKSLEQKTGIVFPPDYLALACRYGSGNFCNYFGFYAPDCMFAGYVDIEHWRRVTKKYWFWTATKKEVMTKKIFLESAFPIGETIDGDDLVMLSGVQGCIYLLPRHADEIVRIDGGFLRAIEWIFQSNERPLDAVEFQPVKFLRPIRDELRVAPKKISEKHRNEYIYDESQFELILSRIGGPVLSPAESRKMASKAKLVEKKSGILLPADHLAAACRLGSGLFNGTVEFYAPDNQYADYEDLDDWKNSMARYWNLGDTDEEIITEELLNEQSFPIGRAWNLDEYDQLIMLSGRPGRVFIRLCDRDEMVRIDGGIVRAVEWILERRGHPFRKIDFTPGQFKDGKFISRNQKPSTNVKNSLSSYVYNESEFLKTLTKVQGPVLSSVDSQNMAAIAKAEEKRNGIKFPADHLTASCRFGTGVFNGSIEFYAPNFRFEGSGDPNRSNIEEWRYLVTEDWKLDYNDDDIMTMDLLMEQGFQVGSAYHLDDIDLIMMLASRPGCIYILLYDSNTFVRIDGGIVRAVEWILEHRGHPFETIEFKPKSFK